MPYNFGFPDVPVAIHFPEGGANSPQIKNSQPWYWYLTVQLPHYWCYLGGNWGPGWLWLPDLPIIKILGADTQKLVPTTNVGFTSADDAIAHIVPGVTDLIVFGRFHFTDPFFWRVIGQPKPEFNVINGLITNEGKPDAPKNIGQFMKTAVMTWLKDWNGTANLWNQEAAAVQPSVGMYPFPKTLFSVPLPSGIGGLPDSEAILSGDAYQGPVPFGFWFEGGTVQIFKQAFAFKFGVQQLDPTMYDMSVFPPVKKPPQQIGNVPVQPSKDSGDYSGYGGYSFPQNSPVIIGGGN